MKITLLLLLLHWRERKDMKLGYCNFQLVIAYWLVDGSVFHLCIFIFFYETYLNV